MRRWIAVLCAVVVVPVMPATAENSAIGESAPPLGVERPWLEPPLDARLAQAGEEARPEDVDARIAELKAQRAGISRRLPTAGLIAGGVLTSVGVATLSVNSLCGWDWGDDDDDDDCTGGWVAGGILTGVGVTLLGTGGWFHAKRTRERRAIDRQIETLKSSSTARRAPSFRVGFDVGERKGVRLAWRY